MLVATLVAVTVARCTMPPPESRTVPVRMARIVCADAGRAALTTPSAIPPTTSQPAARATRRMLMMSLRGRGSPYERRARCATGFPFPGTVLSLTLVRTAIYGPTLENPLRLLAFLCLAFFAAPAAGLAQNPHLVTYKGG